MSSDHIPLIYVDCDMPEGVTLTEWRREKAAAERQAREEARSLRPRHRLLKRRGTRPALRPALRPRFA